MYVVNYISDLGEQLDASALVQGCRLQDPLVVLTVLLRHSFENGEALTNVEIRKASFESTHF
jgi:hypothetical protein